MNAFDNPLRFIKRQWSFRWNALGSFKLFDDDRW